MEKNNPSRVLKPKPSLYRGCIERRVALGTIETQNTIQKLSLCDKFMNMKIYQIPQIKRFMLIKEFTRLDVFD